MADENFSPALCRAARAAIQWDQRKLAGMARVSRATLVKFEGGFGVPSANNLAAIRRAFEDEGFAFSVSGGAERLEISRGAGKPAPDRPEVPHDGGEAGK